MKQKHSWIKELFPCHKKFFQTLESKYEELLPRRRKGEKFLTYEEIENSVEGIILPLPDKIYLLGEDAVAIDSQLFSAEIEKTDAVDILLLKQVNKQNHYAKELVSSLELSEKNPVLFRTFFRKSVEFQRECNRGLKH